MRRCLDGRRPGGRGLTILEVLLALALLAVVVWLLLPKADTTAKYARRAACNNKLRFLYSGLGAYLNSNNDTFPLAWHVSGPSVADDLSNLLYSRFAIHEAWDPTGFSHIVTPRDVEQSVGAVPARRQKFHTTALFWKCPGKGWTDDYFAPETIFRKSGSPARRAELTEVVSPTERPLFADVNASFPDPNASHLQDPGHDHELRNGFSMVSESGADVFLGVGPSLRVEGHLPSSRLDFRHGDNANVIFLDGHADSLPSANAPRIEALHRAWNHLAGKPEGK